MLNDVPSPLAWLLLGDGHAVPISGLSPDDIKVARKRTQERAGVALKHVTGLNAILHCLGFGGDLGNYRSDHWPELQRRMGNNGLAEARNLFEVGPNDLSFGVMKRKRRALADRIFLGPKPRPLRVFLGFGHDWESWDRLHDEVGTSMWLPDDDRFEPRDMEETRRWVYRHRVELKGVHNFVGDQLLDVGRPGKFDAQVYFTTTGDRAAQECAWTRMQKAMDALRWFIDRREDGWIEIIQVTDELVLLKGPGNNYDMLWRNLREDPPPAQDPNSTEPILQPPDRPSSMREEIDFNEWYYFQHFWDEQARHRAEKHHYAGGGAAGERYPGADVILERYLRSTGAYGRKPNMPSGKATPIGFVPVRIDSRSLFVSEMITVGEYRRFADETGYMERRVGESWSAANDGDKDSAPVGVTYLDALAFCAWKERTLKVAVRLLTLEEHRALRPFASAHYESLALLDFPWETFPPRFGLEPSVRWSEPRFLEPGPGVPEFPDPDGRASKSRKRWIPEESWPPRALWRDPIPWAEHSRLSFIDAWDAYEWCAPGRIAGRYWEGPIALKSWGEYKNVKVDFRIVVEQGGHRDSAR